MTTTHRPARHDASRRHRQGRLLLTHLLVSVALWALIIWVFRAVVS